MHSKAVNRQPFFQHHFEMWLSKLSLLYISYLWNQIYYCQFWTLKKLWSFQSSFIRTDWSLSFFDIWLLFKLKYPVIFLSSYCKNCLKQVLPFNKLTDHQLKALMLGKVLTSPKPLWTNDYLLFPDEECGNAVKIELMKPDNFYEVNNNYWNNLVLHMNILLSYWWSEYFYTELQK